MITWNGREMVGDLPTECILDCSSSGDVTESVQFWCKKLGFNPPREFAVQYLSEFGCWDDLDTADDDTIAERVLWLFAGYAKDTGEPFYYLGI